MRILKKRPSGRAEIVGIYHGKKVKPLKVPAGEFMSVLGKDKVKSTWFDIKLDEGKYVIDGHGWGHGVGMCQAGAIAMARKKIGYKAILTQYYPKSALKRFWQ
jgi:stage II sporulation protein D